MRQCLLLILFYLITSDITAQRLVKQYHEVSLKLKAADLKGAVLLTKRLEKKAVNKIYYARRILLYSYKDSNYMEFYAALKRLINYSCYEYESVNKNKFEKFPGWRDSLNKYYSASLKKMNRDVFFKPDLASLLVLLKERDILHRSKVNDLVGLLKENKISFDQFRYLSDSIMKLQEPVDKLNQFVFDSIVNADGELPNYRNADFDGGYTSFLIIQHMNDVALRKKYIKKHKKLLPEFLLNIEYYPMIVDRTKLLSNKKLVFGMAVKYDELGSKQMAAKLKRLRVVNKKRVLYGLVPLEK